MRLTPTERDRLLIFTAAELARARRARGLRLNVPESVALIADTVCEAARDGRRLAEAVEAGRRVLTTADVLPGVAEVVTEVQVEAVFEDGTRLAVIGAPIGEPTGALAGGLRGNSTELPAEEAIESATEPLTEEATEPATELLTEEAAEPAAEEVREESADDARGKSAVEIIGDSAGAARVAGPSRAQGALQPLGGPPGSILPRDESQFPAATPVDEIELEVHNAATVPISVTSHFHFFESNPRLSFDRAAAYGRHLAVPAGSSVRFDPGATVRVRLVPIGGARVAIGFAGLVDGPLDVPGAKEAALKRAAACGYLGAEPGAEFRPAESRAERAAEFGGTESAAAEFTTSTGESAASGPTVPTGKPAATRPTAPAGESTAPGLTVPAGESAAPTKPTNDASLAAPAAAQPENSDKYDEPDAMREEC